MVATRLPTFAEDAAFAARLARTQPAPLTYAGAPVLRGQAKAVPQGDIAGEAIQQLLAVMVQTMRKARGVGLAAPQIGVDLAIAVLQDAPENFARTQSDYNQARDRAPLPLCVIVNPQVRRGSDRREATFFEGCLSVPHYGADVRRAWQVEVTGLDGYGQPFVWQPTGWPARIVQHEVDHLRGVLYVDRMASKTLAYDAPGAG